MMQIMKTPKSVDISITNKCNLRCKHCSHYTSAGTEAVDLTKEEWLKFFEELGACAVLDVCIEGGEAFCREDLKELIEGIICNRMRFSILSNGTLITDEMAKFLASTGRCNSVQVSIDGSIPTTHDALRGKGAFLKAVDGIRNLINNKISTTVRVTINKHNVRELDRIAEFLLEDIKLDGFSTNSASYMGLCRKNADELQLNVEERFIAMEELLRLNKKYNNRISAAAGPLAEAKMWTKMEEARIRGKERIEGRGRLTGCGGPFSKLAIRADGVMVPCLQMSHIELGRINKDGLKDVWQNHPELKRIRDRRNVSLNEFEFCRDCSYINYCTGNCPALAYNIIGCDFHPSPDACLKRFLEAGGRLPEAKLLIR